MSTESVELPDRSVKSAAAFRTISEVADELDVAQHVLRFWEGKFPQVKPLKRGGGRRYYRPEDIETLKEIRTLLYRDGYTIKGAQKLLRQKRTKSAPLPVVETPDLLDTAIEQVSEVKKPTSLKDVISDLQETRARLDAILKDVD